MDLSDQKKIDLIFTLFPPEADLSGIDKKLEALAGEEKTKTAELKSISLVIERMTKERAEMALPAGTMAEIKDSIAEKEKQLAETEEAIKDIEAQERADKAKADAEAKAKAEAERVKAKADAEAREREDKAKRAAVEALKKAEKEKQEAVKSAEQKGRKEAKAELKITPQEAKEAANDTRERNIMEIGEIIGFENKDDEFKNAINIFCRDLERILSVMQATKCPQCAAIILVKTLKQKYQGKEAA
jgi:colicin import membrane protein